ncbi:MAG TPA: hypothetical protein ENL22_03765 [candidate division Zixibacteria bacterium]|nr:hypothetical protein [candidate division Zixibacteria bacterium]
MKNRLSNIINTLILVSLCLVLYSVSWGNIFYCIDPGHGGNESGCTTHITGYNEEHVNMDVGIALKDILEAAGLVLDQNFIFTRLIDTTILLKVRPVYCKC